MPLKPFDPEFTVDDCGQDVVKLGRDPAVDYQQVAIEDPAPRMDSPVARTKKVAAGRRTRCSLRSSFPSM